MKKVLIALMITLMTAGTFFAKPVDFETDNYYILTDDENEQIDFGERSDAYIITLLVNAFPKKTGKYENKYTGFSFEEVDDPHESIFDELPEPLKKFNDFISKSIITLQGN